MLRLRCGKANAPNDFKSALTSKCCIKKQMKQNTRKIPKSKERSKDGKKNIEENNIKSKN